MAAATAVKMAATCMLVLTMMAATASASAAPLVQADAAPTARRLLAADHDASVKKMGDCPCGPFTPWCCSSLQKTAPENCPCGPFTPWCCSGLQKKTAPENCPCGPWTPWCCTGLQIKTKENCPCHPAMPWCCFGAGGSATN